MLSNQEVTLESQKAEIKHLRRLINEIPLKREQNKMRTTNEWKQKDPQLSKMSHNAVILWQFFLWRSRIDLFKLQRLIETGQQCLGEKHYDIIVKQRGVISQLKEQVGDLELTKPPSKLTVFEILWKIHVWYNSVLIAVGSHQATLQELSRVKYELLKAKAAQISSRQQEMPKADCKKALTSNHVVHQELQNESKLRDILGQSERSVSIVFGRVCN